MDKSNSFKKKRGEKEKMKKFLFIIIIFIIFLSLSSCKRNISNSILGPEISLSDYLGKVVLLDFWAEWCGPCKAATPVIVSIYDKFRTKGFEVIGMNLDDENDFDKALDYIRKSKIKYPITVNGFSVAQKYDVKGIPKFILIDKEGKIALIITGYIATLKDDLESSIEYLLNENNNILDNVKLPKSFIPKEKRNYAPNFKLPTLKY